MPDNFTILHHVSVPTDPSNNPHGLLATQWCPTMDLLATITTDHTLRVHRLNWQLLFQIELDVDDDFGEVCLQWRLDGKAIYIGCTDGKLLHVSVEQHAVVHTEQLCQAAIYSMQVTQLKHDSRSAHSLNQSLKHNNDTAVALFAALPVLPKPTSLLPNAAQQQQQVTDTSKSEIDHNNTVMATITDDAQQSHALHGTLQLTITLSADSVITLSAFGTLPVLRLNVAQISGHSDAVINNASFDADGTNLFVCYTHKQQLLTTTFDTSFLQQRYHELSYIAIQYQHITRLLQYIQQCLIVIHSQHKYIQRQLRAKFDALIDVLNEHNLTDNQVEQCQLHMYTLLTAGIPSPILHEFVQRFLSTQLLQKTQQNIDLHYVKINDVVLLALMPACRQLLHRWTELRGCAMWTDRYGCVGFAVDTFDKTVKLTQALMLKINDVQYMYMNARHNVSALLSWFIPYVRVIANEPEIDDVNNSIAQYDIAAIVQCIQHGLFTDAIDQQFTNDAITVATETTNNDLLFDILQSVNIKYDSVTLKLLLAMLNSTSDVSQAEVANSTSNAVMQQCRAAKATPTTLLTAIRVDDSLLQHGMPEISAAVKHAQQVCQLTALAYDTVIRYAVCVYQENTTQIVLHRMSDIRSDRLHIDMSSADNTAPVAIVQVLLYKENTIAVLTQQHDTDDKPLAKLHLINVAHDLLQHPSTITIDQLTAASVNEGDPAVRGRSFSNTVVHSMSVCGQRGVGSVYTLSRAIDVAEQLPTRVVILDLADDEAVEEGDTDIVDEG